MQLIMFQMDLSSLRIRCENEPVARISVLPKQFEADGERTVVVTFMPYGEAQAATILVLNYGDIACLTAAAGFGSYESVLLRLHELHYDVYLPMDANHLVRGN